MKSTSIVVLLMITEEEISHQNNNIFDLSHPNVWSVSYLSIVKSAPQEKLLKGGQQLDNGQESGEG